MLLIFLTFSFGILVIVTALYTRAAASDAATAVLVSFPCIIFIFVLIKISHVNDFCEGDCVRRWVRHRYRHRRRHRRQLNEFLISSANEHPLGAFLLIAPNTCGFQGYTAFVQKINFNRLKLGVKRGHILSLRMSK